MRETVWSGGKIVSQTGSAPTLAEAQAEKRQAINDEWRARTAAGVLVSGVRVETDEKSQTQIRGALEHLTDATPGTTISFVTRSGAAMTAGLADMTAMRNVVRGYVVACAEREAELVAAVNAAETVEAVQAIDHTEGWP